MFTYTNGKCNGTFSLNPISDQLAFFDTSFSAKQGHSRTSSPLIYPKDNQHDILSQSRNCSRMSQNCNLLKHNEKDVDNISFNSSLDRLTQEKFLELQPKAESSPKSLINKSNCIVSEKSWMEQKITINISFYSIILFSSVAANVALIIYFMS